MRLGGPIRTAGPDKANRLALNDRIEQPRRCRVCPVKLDPHVISHNQIGLADECDEAPACIYNCEQLTIKRRTQSHKRAFANSVISIVLSLADSLKRFRPLPRACPRSQGAPYAIGS